MGLRIRRIVYQYSYQSVQSVISNSSQLSVSYQSPPPAPAGWVALKQFLAVVVLFAAIAVVRADETAGTKPIDISSRRELFVDQYLTDTLHGG